MQNNTRKKIIMLICLSLLLTPPAFATLLLNAGIKPFELYAGARPLGLGGAFVARADEVNAAFYNPAGLVRTKGIAATYASVGDIAAAQVFSIGNNRVLGIALGRRNFTEGNSFSSYSSTVVMGTFAEKLNLFPFIPDNEFTKNFYWGANGKVVLSQSLAVSGATDQTSNGWNMDLGAIWRANGWLSLGVKAENVLGSGFLGAGRFTWIGGTVEAHNSSAIFGISAQLVGGVAAPVYAKGHELFVNFDVDANGGKVIGSATSSLLRVGLDWNYEKILSGQIGLNNANQEGKFKPAAGLGLRQGGWGINLGYGTMNNNSGVLLTLSYFPSGWKAVEGLVMVKNPIKFWISREAEQTYSQTFVVSGEVAEGARVFVNGQEAFVLKNMFKVLVPLNRGKNLIDIKGKYLGKEILRFSKKVFRKAKVIIAEEKQIDKKIEELVKKEETNIIASKAKIEKKLKSKTISKPQKAKLIQARRVLVKKEKKIQEQKKKLIKEKRKIEKRKEKVEVLVTMGVVDVKPEKDFEMEAQVTRGELATWLVKAAAIPLPQVHGSVFKDVPADHPMAPYIKVITDLKIMQAFADGTFRPDKGLTEEEGKAIFKRFGVIR